MDCVVLPIKKSQPEPQPREAFAPHWQSLAGDHRGVPAPPRPVTHPAFDRMMARLPPAVRATLTYDQVLALAAASIPMPQPHAIDYRVSIPFFGKRYYLTILAGKERRSLERLMAEGQLFLSKGGAFHYLLVGSVMLVVTAIVACLAYGIIQFLGGGPQLETMPLDHMLEFSGQY